MKENLPGNEQQQAPASDNNGAAGPTTAVAEQGVSTPPMPNKTVAGHKNTSGPGWVVWCITVLLAVIGIVASVYVWQDANKQRQQLHADVAGLIQRTTEQATELRNAQRELDRYNSAANQQHRQSIQQVNDVKQQISSLQKRLHSLSSTDRDDWLLAEAEYLIRLANQRLLMGKDISGAEELLKAADTIIKDLDDHALYTVRQMLAREIAALHAASRFDLEGVYLKLDAIATQVDQLRLFVPLSLEKPEQPPPSPDEHWQQRLVLGVEAALEKLSNYVQIRRRDDIYKPVLAPEYEVALRQNVRLMFEQAQMALLSGNQSLYIKSLSKAKQWLNTYYTLDKKSANKAQATIEQLLELKITITLPDISGSLRALKNYVETIHAINTKLANKEKEPPIAEETPTINN